MYKFNRTNIYTHTILLTDNCQIGSLNDVGDQSDDSDAIGDDFGNEDGKHINLL